MVSFIVKIYNCVTKKVQLHEDCNMTNLQIRLSTVNWSRSDLERDAVIEILHIQLDSKAENLCFEITRTFKTSSIFFRKSPLDLCRPNPVFRFSHQNNNRDHR